MKCSLCLKDIEPDRDLVRWRYLNSKDNRRGDLSSPAHVDCYAVLADSNEAVYEVVQPSKVGRAGAR